MSIIPDLYSGSNGLVNLKKSVGLGLTRLFTICEGEAGELSPCLALCKTLRLSEGLLGKGNGVLAAALSPPD